VKVYVVLYGWNYETHYGGVFWRRDLAEEAIEDIKELCGENFNYSDIIEDNIVMEKTSETIQ